MAATDSLISDTYLLFKEAVKNNIPSPFLITILDQDETQFLTVQQFLEQEVPPDQELYTDSNLLLVNNVNPRITRSRFYCLNDEPAKQCRTLVTEMKEQINYDQQLVEQAERVYSFIDEIENHFNSSPVDIKLKNRIYLVEYQGKSIDLNLGLYLFDLIEVNESFPFLSYHSEEKAHYKIDKEFTFLNRINSDPGPGKLSFLHHRGGGKKKDFFRIELDLKESKLITPNDQTIVNQFFDLIPGMTVKTKLSGIYSANFELSDPEGQDLPLNYETINFFFLLLTDYNQVGRDIFYTKDRITASSLKSRVNFHLKMPLVEYGENIGLYKKVESDYTLVSPLNSKFVSFTISLIKGEHDRYSINIKRALTIQDIDIAKIVISKFLSAYFEQYREIEESVKSLISDKKDVSVPSQSVKQRGSNTTPLKILQAYAPGLFTRGYGTNCPKKPKPVLDEQPKDKEILEIEHGGEVKRFYCDNGQITTFEHQGQIVPCCVAQRKSETRASSGTGTLQNPAKTIKMLQRDSYSVLPTNLSGLFSLGKNELLRRGVASGPDSFLEAVLVAVDIVTTVPQFKRNILKISQPGLFKQELFDISDVKDYLNRSEYLDPDHWYRAVEEYLGVNIYIFTITGLPNTSPGQIMVPRHSLTHVRPYRKRKALLFFINQAINQVGAGYLQTDLIVSYREGNEEAFFSEHVSRICHSLLVNTRKALIYDPLKRQVYDNVYNLKDIAKQLGFRYRYTDNGTVVTNGIAQYLDDLGKCQGLTISLINSKQKVVVVSFFFVPTAPLNLPVTKKFVRCHYRDMVDILEGDITGYTLDKEARVNGYWFSRGGYRKGVYLPIKAGTGKVIGQEFSFYGNDIAVGGPRRECVERQLRIVLGLVKWLYLIYRSNVGKSFLSFVRSYSVTDSLVNSDYQLSTIDSLLPVVNNVTEGLSYLARYSNLVTADNKIRWYNQNFKKGIVNYFRDFQEHNDLDEMEIPFFIPDYYRSSDDFRYYENNIVLYNKEELEHWFENSNHKIVVKAINKAVLSSTEPFYHQDSNGNIWLVQAGFDLEEAIWIARQWNEQGYNPGYSSTVNTVEITETSSRRSSVGRRSPAASSSRQSSVSRRSPAATTSYREYFLDVNQSIITGDYQSHPINILKHQSSYWSLLPMISPDDQN